MRKRWAGSKAVSLEPGDNHRSKPWSSEEERSIEHAFLRLGDVLAEIANELEKRNADISEHTARNKNAVATSQQTLDDGENGDGKCKNGTVHHISHQ